jgi:isopentenyldiphosphate isomerase
MPEPPAQPAQDPDELFDIVDEDGRPTGRTKRRADVHRDGDWHRAIHIWVWGVDAEGPYLLMNQRGRRKDTWPLALDATVGGHLVAGETVEDAYREVEEELGITVAPERLQFLFSRARVSDGHLSGIIDRERQEIFLLRDDRPLTAFRPQVAELEGIARMRLADATALFNGEVGTAPAEVLRAGDRRIVGLTVTPEQLLVRGDDPYFRDIARAVADEYGKTRENTG